MKTCPYCKEDVHDNAIKCRHCHSMLLPVQLPEEVPDDRRVTYVVDRDLIRFGKFAGGVLAIFLVVGAFAFGFKLENALDEAEELQKDAELIKDHMAVAQKDLETAQNRLILLKTEVEGVLEAARAKLGDIDTQFVIAVGKVAAFPTLTSREAASLDEAKRRAPATARVEGNTKLWLPGAKLRIRFLNGEPAKHVTVREAIVEWAKYANFIPAFVPAGDAEIRISFDRPGSWSYLGTDALAISALEPTMNFEWVDRRTVLHEFGHALGLVHEHQQPDAEIPWNKELIYAEATEAPYFLSRTTIEHTIFSKYSSDLFPVRKPFDPNSIMAQAFPPAWTDGLILGQASDLSPGDRAFIAQVYPKSSDPAPNSSLN